MPGVPRDAAAALDALDRIGDRAQTVVTSQVRRRPIAAANITRNVLWSSRGTVTAARDAAVEFVSRQTGRRVGRVLTPAEADEVAFQRRIADLRLQGRRVQQVDGRWLVYTGRRKQLWVPVKRPRQLVEDRLYRARLAANAAADRLAREMGFDGARASRTLDWVHPRVEARYRTTLAIGAGRIAHDATADAFRDATFEQMQGRGVIGWKRLAERTACGACLALADGRLHPVSDTEFLRHTRCRCVPVPVTRSSAAIPTGRELFDAMTVEEQDRVFHSRGGRAKAQALRDGSIDLPDLVQIDEDRLGVTDYVVTETPTRALALT